MPDYVYSFRLGAATVTIVNIGDLQFRTADWLHIPEAEQLQKHELNLPEPLRFPTQCVHIALPGASVLVDAGYYDTSTDSPYTIPYYQPPPGLLAGLAEAGIQPEKVDHVVVTHGHFDHFNGITQQQDDRYVPCFPQARHFLGRADWDAAQAALEDDDSLESRTLGVLHRQGLLDLVDGRRDLSNRVQIIPTPGETRGHQAVRVCSDGQTLYCVGDLYHHPIEVEYPQWTARWADPDASLTSRQALAEAALDEQALVVATHIPGCGRLQRTAAGCIWVAVELAAQRED